MIATQYPPPRPASVVVFFAPGNLPRMVYAPPGVRCRVGNPSTAPAFPANARPPNQYRDRNYYTSLVQNKKAVFAFFYLLFLEDNIHHQGKRTTSFRRYSRLGRLLYLSPFLLRLYGFGCCDPLGSLQNKYSIELP